MNLFFFTHHPQEKNKFRCYPSLGHSDSYSMKANLMLFPSCNKTTNSKEDYISIPLKNQNRPEEETWLRKTTKKVNHGYLLSNLTLSKTLPFTKGPRSLLLLI